MARVDDVVRLIGHENRGDGKHERTLGAQPLLAVGDGTGGTGDIPAVGRGCPLDIRVVECDLGEDEVAFDDADIERAAPPDGWDIAGSAGAVTYGEQWLRAERSLVLAVPSVLVPDEPNYVINPRHRRAKSLVVSPLLRPFIYDERLLRK